MTVSLSLLTTCLLLGSPQEADKPQTPVHFVNSTAKICQLTDDRDRTRRIPTLSRSGSRASLRGSDLGSSFEHKGKLWFLFGDSRGRPGNLDAMAWTQATDPDQLELHFPLARDGKFRPIAIPGVIMGPYEVPSHGISINDTMFLVSTAGHTKEKTMVRSLLSRSTNDGASFKVLHEFSRDAFINVAFVRASRELHPSLPVDDTVLVFGSGNYRRSHPKLAYIPTARFGRKPAMRFWKEMRNGTPVWTEKESEAQPLFEHPVIGELSVGWLAPLKRWVMLYQGARPAGILMRTAPEPWGPWSEPVGMFDAWNNHGYANFLHASWKDGKKDNFHDKGMENRWGGPYSPFLIDRFTTGDEKRCTIYYTMSTWNPYQVVLMRSDIGFPDLCPPLEFKETLLLPTEADWSRSAKFMEEIDRDGVRHVTTRTRAGKEQGVAHRSIEATVDGTLAFSFHGGEGEVVLVRETQPPPRKIEDVRAFYHELKRGQHGEVVEAIAGPRNNDVDIPIQWSLQRHVGHDLRLYVIDHLAGRWGDIAVSEFKLRSSSPAQAR